MKEERDEWDMLPQGDRQDILQQLSLKAFRNCLPDTHFCFREESHSDKGVDGTLEAKLYREDGSGAGTSRFTNCRANVQLKSTDKPARNADGSVSLSIDMKNLVYLQNGPCPIYVLWISGSDQLLFAWARDEWARLNAADPEWSHKQSFTIRFTQALTKEACVDIHRRILSEARAVKDVFEQLSRSSSHEKVWIGIDPETLECTDSAVLYEGLTQGGMTAVAAGYGGQVINYFEMLSPSHRSDVRVRLIVSYAFCSLGRNLEAVAHIAAVWSVRGSLPLEDRRTLEYVRNVCQYRLGQITLQEFERRDRELLLQAGDVECAVRSMESLRQKISCMESISELAVIGSEIAALNCRVQASREATTRDKLHSNIIALNVEGDQLAAKSMDLVLSARVRRSLGLSSQGELLSLVSSLETTWQAWEEKAERLVRAAYKDGFPLVLADALLARSCVRVKYAHLVSMPAIAEGHSPEGNPRVAEVLATELNRALEIFKKAGHAYGTTQCHLLLAEVFELFGDSSQMIEEAGKALTQAEAMGYETFVEVAEKLLKGESLFQTTVSNLRRRREADEDISVASLSDEDVESIAHATLETYGLPKSRLLNAEKEWRAFRRIAQERIEYCRHMQIIQDLSVEGDPILHYLHDAVRSCVCLKHRYESQREGSDPDVSISSLKNVYCTLCPDKAPKASEG